MTLNVLFSPGVYSRFVNGFQYSLFKQNSFYRSISRLLPVQPCSLSIRGYHGSRGSSFTRPGIKQTLKMDNLPMRSLPDEVFSIESGENPPEELQAKLTSWATNKASMRQTERNYIESFRTMIDFEEAAEEVQRNKCSHKDIKLYHVDENEFYFLVEPEMKDLNSFVRQFDRCMLTSKDGSIALEGEIVLKENTKIFVELEGDIDMFQENQLYDITFHNNRTFHLLQHQALNYVRDHKLFELLIDNPKYHHGTVSSDITSDNKTRNTTTGLNVEQITAIEQIVGGDHYPLPYLLYGPPGTGKTKTLVAAIKEIVRSTNKTILVCAQSNAACDEITTRLKTSLNRDEMLRLYSKSKDLDIISPAVKMFCNLFGGELKYPRLSSIYEYRVVICTLATAGCLTRAQCNPKHFDYVIIDECASALEPMALVPIAGLCTTPGEVHANIILAGDPKQLDAVTKSEWATKLGYGVSWMEQLFKFPLYQRDEQTAKFNSKYITQLVKNYRSHPAILHVPNQLFYDGYLEPKVSANLDDLNVRLPDVNVECPVVFKSVQGFCVKPENDTSSYNVEEIVEIMAFLKNLFGSDGNLRQSDIGIVSPYRMQCEMIRVTCKSSGLDKITVGTAETFQGQERKVIIASTVSSGNDTLGWFVSDPQRFNVMITRAKYLLIVVGDPHTLSTDPNWSAFLKFCYDNGNLIQSDQPFAPEEVSKSQKNTNEIS